MGKLHSNAALGEVHKIHNYEYDDLTSAQAATWSADDVGKVFRILDEPNYYIIKTSGGEFMQIPSEDVQEVQTSDATVTSCGEYATANDYVYHVEVRALASVDTGGNAASYTRMATFKNDSGTLSAVGSVTSDHTAEDSAGWEVTLDANGTDIRVRVTGQAATTINWVAYVQIKVLANGA